MKLTTVSETLKVLDGVAELDGETLFVTDEERFRKEAIPALAAAAESPNFALAEAASWLVWTASQALGSGVGSLKGVYDSMGRSELSRTVVSCFELGSTKVRPTARAIFAAADALEAGTICFAPRLGAAPVSSSDRRIFVTNVLASAVEERWTLPVFFGAGPFAANGAQDRNQRHTVAASMADGFLDISVLGGSFGQGGLAIGSASSDLRSLTELGRFVREHQPASQPVTLTAAMGGLEGTWSREALSTWGAQLGALSAEVGLSKFRLAGLDESLSSARPSDALDAISRLADALRADNRIAGASIGGAAWRDEALSSDLLDGKTAEARLGAWLEGKTASIEARDDGAFEVSLQERVKKLLDRLEQRGSRDLVRRHAIPMPFPRPRPQML